MDGRKRDAILCAIVALDVEIGQKRDIIEKSCKPILGTGNLCGEFLYVLKAVVSLGIIPLVAEMVFVEQIAEIFHDLAYFPLGKMVIRRFKAF